MNRYSNERERDEQGRFVSEDDDGRRHSGGYRSRREDDDGRRRYQSSSRDDDDYRRGGRYDDDRRGWYGDPEGHAQAARRGWDEREGERGSYRGRSDDRD